MEIRKMAVLAIVIVAITAMAFPLRQMNYQGKLTDPSGVAVEGSRIIRFSIWNAATLGTEQWNETHTVTVVHGLFDVVLGSLPTTPINVDFSANAWIQLRVEGEDLIPRQPLNPVSSAYRAAIAESLVGGVISAHNSMTGIQGGASGEYYHLTNAEWTSIRANNHAPGSDNQNLFASVTDGSASYTASSETDQLQITGTGGATVSVNSTTGQITVSASGASDNWGTQFVQTDASLAGRGISTDLLVIANGGVKDYHVDWGLGASQVNAIDVPYDYTGDVVITTGNVDGALGNLDGAIGNRLYTENNYVTDGEAITASIDNLDMEIADITGGTSNSYIRNQYASAQTADYWVGGDGKIDGDLTVGNIVGQGSASNTVGSTVAIASPSTPSILTSLTYTAAGAGSTVHIAFSGTFDDKGGQEGAYVHLELVRDPGPGETVLSTSDFSIFSQVVYQLQAVSIIGMDIPPAGLHTYQVRANVVKAPYASGRCLNGLLKLEEIKN